MREILVLIMISSYNRPSVRSTFHVSRQYAKCHTAIQHAFFGGKLHRLEPEIFVFGGKLHGQRPTFDTSF